MAGLWTGLTLNNTVLAKAFNLIAERRSVPMVVKQCALLYAMSNRDDPFNQSVGSFAKSEKVSGVNTEWPLLGALATPAAISDGSDENSTSTPNYDSAAHGAAQLAIAHYGLTQAVPESEYLRIRGSEAKTTSWVAEVSDYLRDSYDDVLATAVHANTAPTRAAFGGWQYAVDDNNTYAQVDRSDAGNADFRSVVIGGTVTPAAFGDTTLAKLQAQKNAVRKNKGRPTIMVMGETLFAKVQNQVQAYAHVTYNAGSAAQFGSDDFIWAGMKGLYDHRTTAGLIGMIDPKWWRFVQNDTPFTETGLVRDITKKAMYAIVTTLWIQNYLLKPNTCVKLVGAT